MSDLMLALLGEDVRFQKMIKNIKGGEKQQFVSGLGEQILPFVVHGIQKKMDRPVLVVTTDQQQSQSLMANLSEHHQEVYLFPDLEILPHERLEADLTVKRQRLKILESLLQGENPLIFLSITALLRTLIPANIFQGRMLSFQAGEFLDTEACLESLISLGYKREARVETPGEMSIRGGILDIYPPSFQDPIRVELFGDIIESIRFFDQGTQRSHKELNEVLVGPSREDLIPAVLSEEMLESIEKDREKVYRRLIKVQLQDEAHHLDERISQDLDRLKEGVPFPGSSHYLPYFYRLEPLWSYLSRGIFAVYNPGQVLRRAEGMLNEWLEVQTGLLEQGSILPRYQEHFLELDTLRSFIQQQVHLLFSSQEELRWESISHEFSLETRGVEPFRGQMERFQEVLQDWLKKDYRVLLAIDGERKAKRMAEYLQEQRLPVDTRANGSPPQGRIMIISQTLERGFSFPGQKMVLYTEKEIFGQKEGKKRHPRGIEGGVRLKTFEELEVGDHVVHENHGIGKYLGIKTLEVQDLQQDYLVIKYSGADRLYVPTNQIHVIQKYIGMGENTPRLNKLGGQEWNRAKNKVKASVEEMAEDLLELYAEREVNTGFSFSQDTVWQQEFEEEFPYEETPDQIQATEEIKRDMESERPMDRLLCGDVGYGKTEVAIRAAFKAVMDEKQVAVLVPTTILAQQHYNTFRDRFHNYPIKVEMLSRFRSQKEQKKILKDLSAGTVDVIIATHRLLSRDVDFFELGLLIVDEEQRFGVSHKERLKDLKKSVDVLTLTATPIPRTLHMSLVKVRDMSIIETPPENRYPIRTYVREYDEDLITSAIERELGRGGQVYYVHNRVENIQEVARKLQKLVPQARIGISHGQMGERELEEMMLRFLVGDYDVLVCTTIIENGLDIANVNTIIVNNADHMGLAQLYQLRGRVGRSNRVAYAYLFYRTNRILGEDAEKRLQAIKEFSSLGSGFKLAMRDLEIRGAGNLLGSEQHGHIAAIGFSLYCRLLEEAIQELKGIKPKEEESLEMEMEVNAFIPDTYIPDSRHKIEIYKKTARIKRKEDIVDLKEELQDRFGPLPPPVGNLIRLAHLKCWGLELGVKKMVEKDKKLSLFFQEECGLTGEHLIQLSRRFPRRIRFRAAKDPVIVLNLAQYDRDEKIEPVYELFEYIDSLTQAVTA